VACARRHYFKGESTFLVSINIAEDVTAEHERLIVEGL
jgi:hypothetical protein